jgi:hypothetical protein
MPDWIDPYRNTLGVAVVVILVIVEKLVNLIRGR